MDDLITLKAAGQAVKMKPATLREWISRGVISGAAEIKSYGRAGGRKGYYPATIIPEIQTAIAMQEDGLKRETIARARTLALELMADPTKEADPKAIAETGPAARQWLDIYAGITEAPAAQKALERLERDISHLLTLVIRGMRYHMIDIIDRLADVMDGTEKE